MPTRSPVPGLCLLALANDPTSDRPYTTTEVRDIVARLGKPVTRDTVATHLRRLNVTNRPNPPVQFRGKRAGGEHLWALTAAGWQAHLDAVRPEFAFCEPVTAVALGTWHIRRLTAAGRKLGGGIDTPTLCGRTWEGWDLEAPVTVTYASKGAWCTNASGRRDVCPDCADQLPLALRAAPPTRLSA